MVTLILTHEEFSMVRFKCSECNCDVIDTKLKEEPLPLTVYNQPWLKMCSECELIFFKREQEGAESEKEITDSSIEKQS
jgi:hypothetical protein